MKDVIIKAVSSSGNTYKRLIDKEGFTHWIHSNGERCPAHQQVKLEQMYLNNNLYKKAAEYAGLNHPIDRGEEKHYNPTKLAIYDAYIAGNILAMDQLVNGLILEI